MATVAAVSAPLYVIPYRLTLPVLYSQLVRDATATMNELNVCKHSLLRSVMSDSVASTRALG